MILFVYMRLVELLLCQRRRRIITSVPLPGDPERTTLVPMNLTVTILTSTVVATLISAVISGGFALWGQKLERNSRSRETIFTQSVELAKANRQFTMELAKEMGGGMTIHDYAVYAEMYYWLLMELHDKGKLPEHWQTNMKTKFPESK